MEILVFFGRFQINHRAKGESVQNRKMVSDNNGGFTPTISLKKKPEGGPWQRKSINPVVLVTWLWRCVGQTTQDENWPFWSTISVS